MLKLIVTTVLVTAAIASVSAAQSRGDLSMNHPTSTDRIALTLHLEDDRRSRTTFESVGKNTRVRTVFDPEAENPMDMQREGWQAILDSYAAYVARTT